MKTKTNYLNVLKETFILTVAVAIIAAAVYFFLVPSHTSVSSISGSWYCTDKLYSAPSVCDQHDPEHCSPDHRFFHLWQGIWR